MKSEFYRVHEELSLDISSVLCYKLKVDGEMLIGPQLYDSILAYNMTRHGFGASS